MCLEPSFPCSYDGALVWHNSEGSLPFWDLPSVFPSGPPVCPETFVSFVQKPGCQLPHSLCPSHHGVCLRGLVVEDLLREKAIETGSTFLRSQLLQSERTVPFFQMLGACRAYWGLRKWEKEKEQRISLHLLKVLGIPFLLLVPLPSSVLSWVQARGHRKEILGISLPLQ